MFKTDGRPIEKYNEVSFQLSEIPSIVAATSNSGAGDGCLFAHALGAVVRGSLVNLAAANHFGTVYHNRRCWLQGWRRDLDWRDNGLPARCEAWRSDQPIICEGRTTAFGLYPHAEPIKLLVCSSRYA